MEYIRLHAAELLRQTKIHSRAQPLHLKSRHRPSELFNLVGNGAAIAQAQKMKVELLAVGMPGELDEQFLHPAHVQLADEVNDASRSTIGRLAPLKTRQIHEPAQMRIRGAHGRTANV